MLKINLATREPKNRVHIVGDGTAEIELTQGQFATVDEASLAVLVGARWCAAWSGNQGSFYATTGRGKVARKMHQAVLHRTPSDYAKDRLVVDHINRNTLDNRRCNLQLVSHRRNTTKDRNASKKRLTGAFWFKRDSVWQSQIRAFGLNINLGRFDTEKQAHDVYARALLLVAAGIHPRSGVRFK